MDTEKNEESEVITHEGKLLPTWAALAISMVLATVLVGVFLYIGKANEPARQLASDKTAVVEFMMQTQNNVRSLAGERKMEIGDPLTVEMLKESNAFPPIPKLARLQVSYHYADKVPALGEPYVTVDNREIMSVIEDARDALIKADRKKKF